MIDIKKNSKKVNRGDTFIAIKGDNRDGHDYIEDAIKNGATKIICEVDNNYPVETLVVDSTYQYFNDYLYNNYYPLFKDIKLIGVTGTSGKTTTCFIMYQMLKELGCKVAYIGTIGFYYNDIKRELANTTPELDILYEMLIECKNNGIEYVVMEVSSHAIGYDRIYGLEFDLVGFTNLTPEHLDYHLNMENYLETKQKLFTRLRDKRVCVINVDSEYGNKFLFNSNNNIRLGKNNADLIISDIVMDNQGISFNFNYNDISYNTKINMVGEYNVYNYLTALLLTHSIGFDVNDILKLNDNIKAPRGRMEMVKFNTNSIFIDYAHKPDAVLNVLKSTLEFKKGKVITIIGCGGNRDKTKRPVMGDIATTYSDYVIFTNDNPRFEDEVDIMNDIIAGVKKDNYEIIYDRLSAINKGISMLNDKDILLILGKGHEDYQIIGDKKYHFDDLECVKEYISNNR